MKAWMEIANDTEHLSIGCTIAVIYIAHLLHLKHYDVEKVTSVNRRVILRRSGVWVE